MHLNRFTRPFLAATAALTLAGCDPVTLTLAGVGAGAGVAHTMGGYVYRTFTLPLPRVKSGTLTALNRMAIKVASTEKIETGERINAKGMDRDIEIELEAVSPKTTRMRAIARRSGLLMDSATATEIILQTERVLSGS